MLVFELGRKGAARGITARPTEAEERRTYPEGEKLMVAKRSEPARLALL